MTSFLASNHQLPPQQQEQASLWTGTDSTSRKGGILLNPSSPSRTSIPLHQVTSSNGSHDSLPSDASTASTSAIKSPITPAVNVSILPPPEPTSRTIKFAPLPDPRTFHRSLSTGRNIKTQAILGPGGVRSTELQDQGVYRGDESALADDDELDPEEMYDNGEDDEGSGRRRPSILGSSSWGKSTKKILTLGLASSSSSGSKTFRRTSSIESSKSEGNESSSLSRSLVNLTRSLTPSSPGVTSSHREKKRRPSSSSSVDINPEQRKLLASLSPTSPSSSSRDLSSSPTGRGHRYSSSLDPSDVRNAAILSTSPRSPVGMKMLNGKVYGGRSREAIRKAEEDALKGEDFREWSGSGGLGSVGKRNEEEDDGSGMAWIKKRREERERQQQQQEKPTLPTINTDQSQHPHHLQPSSNLAFPNQPSAAVSQQPSASLPPIIASNAPSPGPSIPEIISIPPTPIQNDQTEMFPPQIHLRSATPSSLAGSDATGADSKRSSVHDVQTFVVPVPGKTHSLGHGGHSRGRTDGSEHATVSPLGIGGGGGVAFGGSTGGASSYEDDADSDSESEGEEEDDDSDDEDDAEEERLTQEARKTAQSAGIEVLSRHKSIEH